MKFFITGGAGFLGTALVKHYLNKYPFKHHVTVFSRDGSKHWSLTNIVKDKELHCVVGDVTSWHLHYHLQNINPSIIIIAHAMKMIDQCERFPSEALRINVSGVENILNAIRKSIIAPAQVVFISSDKAANPISIYGATKLLAEQLIQQAAVEMPHITWTIARYGNVLSSTNSVIPVIKQRIDTGQCLELTSPTMTRFVFTVKEAVDFIDYLIENKLGGLWVPLIPSMRIYDLFQIYSEKYSVDMRLSEKGHRGFREKEHEVLNTEYEQIQQKWVNPVPIHNEKDSTTDLYEELVFGRAQKILSSNSRDCLLNKQQLNILLENEGLL